MKLSRGAIISSLVVSCGALLFHALTVTPHDWGAVFMWLPVYVSPIWIIAGASSLSERRKTKSEL